MVVMTPPWFIMTPFYTPINEFEIFMYKSTENANFRFLQSPTYRDLDLEYDLDRLLDLEYDRLRERPIFVPFRTFLFLFKIQFFCVTMNDSLLACALIHATNESSVFGHIFQQVKESRNSVKKPLFD